LLDLILGDFRAFGPHDEGDRDFTSKIILHSEVRDGEVFQNSVDLRNWQRAGCAVAVSMSNLRHDGGVLDLRVRDEERLELGRRHLEPLVLDDLLEPVDDEDLVVVVDIADVAGVQPAVLVDGVLCRLKVVQVT